MKLRLSIDQASLAEIATAVLAVTKLTGLANISWLAVFSPILFTFAVGLVILTGVGLWKGFHGRSDPTN